VASGPNFGGDAVAGSGYGGMENGCGFQVLANAAGSPKEKGASSIVGIDGAGPIGGSGVVPA
jgi:hypothetical protein